MTRFRDWRGSPDHQIEQELHQSISRLKMILLENDCKLTPEVEKELVQLKSNANKVLITVIEHLTLEQGGVVPSGLEDKYFELLAKEIVQQILNNDVNLHQALANKMTELKRLGIDLGARAKQVEQLTQELLKAQDLE